MEANKSQFEVGPQELARREAEYQLRCAECGGVITDGGAAYQIRSGWWDAANDDFAADEDVAYLHLACLPTFKAEEDEANGNSPDARLTPEQKQAYFAQGTVVCPYCGAKAEADNILWDGIYTEGDGASQKAWCHACQQGWMDIYKLVDVVAV
jgi:hypothetical protein